MTCSGAALLLGMNERELKQWFQNASDALRKAGYSQHEIDAILSWFWYIRGSAERALIGDEAVNALSKINDFILERTGAFNLYNSLMSRLFIYAPLILNEYNETPECLRPELKRFD